MRSRTLLQRAPHQNFNIASNQGSALNAQFRLIDTVLLSASAACNAGARQQQQQTFSAHFLDGLQLSKAVLSPREALLQVQVE